MSYIKITDAHLGDSRWLEAGADAFAVHVWALNYSNKMLLDGKIAKAMAEREALAVPLDKVRQAIDALVDGGFWSVTGNSYVINDYASYALSSDEINATRTRWANDKRRRRKHSNGVHDECDSNCPMSHADSHVDSTVESHGKTRPDQTRPDQTYRSGSGDGQAELAPADAGEHRPHRFRAVVDEPEECVTCGLGRENHLEVAQ